MRFLGKHLHQEACFCYCINGEFFGSGPSLIIPLYLGHYRREQGWVLAIVANEIAGLPPSEKLTFGPVRAEVLSALFSTMFILVLSVFLAYSAVCRLIGELGRGMSRGGGKDIVLYSSCFDMRGAYSYVACLSHMAIENVSLARWKGV